MGDFLDNKNNPEWKARFAYIAYHICKLRPQTMLELGCNGTEIGQYVQGMFSGVIYTGVDHKAYPGMKTSENKHFILDDVMQFVARTEKRYVLTLCSWILVHLNPPKEFWEKLSQLSRYLVTFENENHSFNIGRSLPLMIKKDLIFTENIILNGTEQTLRIFKSDILK